jgi:RNase adapter protein RapZ
MELVLISGLAGAGKSTALKILEDSSYFCIDNLPPSLLPDLIDLYHNSNNTRKIAVSIDSRSHAMLSELPNIISSIDKSGIKLKFIFLDARDDILVNRFSETRRRHPLSDENKTITDCILKERGELSEIANIAHHIDTSNLSANTLRRMIKEFVEADYSQMNIVIQSFGFKYGLPIDSDFMFDVRCLPNPHYDPKIKDFNGLEKPIIDFLSTQEKVQAMILDIYNMINNWFDDFSYDNRNYLTVSIGCTGGKHRSVYITEEIAKLIRRSGYKALTRHRQIG